MCYAWVLPAITAVITGASAYNSKRGMDKAAATQETQYDEQTDRQDDLDTAAEEEHNRLLDREKEADRLAQEERDRQATREAAAEKERQRIRDEQATRERLTTEGRTKVSDAFGSTFDSDFYTGQSKAYTDLAEGELADKYGDAAKQLLFAMTRSGLGQSSARNLRQAKLTGAHTKAGEDIQDTALRREAQLKGQVAERKAALMGQAESMQDPTYMGNTAASQAAMLAKPQTYGGIGDPFAVALSGLTSAFASETRKRQEDDYQRRMQQYNLTGGGASTVVS